MQRSGGGEGGSGQKKCGREEMERRLGTLRPGKAAPLVPHGHPSGAQVHEERNLRCPLSEEAPHHIFFQAVSHLALLKCSCPQAGRGWSLPDQNIRLLQGALELCVEGLLLLLQGQLLLRELLTVFLTMEMLEREVSCFRFVSRLP